MIFPNVLPCFDLSPAKSQPIDPPSREPLKDDADASSADDHPLPLDRPIP